MVEPVNPAIRAMQRLANGEIDADGNETGVSIPQTPEEIAATEVELKEGRMRKVGNGIIRFLRADGESLAGRIIPSLENETLKTEVRKGNFDPNR